MFALAFVMAMAGVLPGFLATLIFGAVGLLAAAWVLVFIAAPIVTGIIDALR